MNHRPICLPQRCKSRRDSEPRRQGCRGCAAPGTQTYWSYFKRPGTKQTRYPVNAYKISMGRAWLNRYRFHGILLNPHSKNQSHQSRENQHSQHSAEKKHDKPQPLLIFSSKRHHVRAKPSRGTHKNSSLCRPARRAAEKRSRPAARIGLQGPRLHSKR
jgi:hypothetical protein